MSFGGRAPFKQYSQRIGRWGARDAGGLTLADPQAVSPTSGCSRTCCGPRAPAPPGASERTRRLRKLCRFSSLVNPFFLLLLKIFIRLLVNRRSSFVESVTVDAATNVAGTPLFVKVVVSCLYLGYLKNGEFYLSIFSPILLVGGVLQLGHLEGEASVAVPVVSGGSDNLAGVEAVGTDVVGGVVEEGGELAEGLGLEVELLVFLLALVLGLLKFVQSLLHLPLELVEALLVVVVERVEPGGQVGGAQEA